jgi:hypothetical protein
LGAVTGAREALESADARARSLEATLSEERERVRVLEAELSAMRRQARGAAERGAGRLRDIPRDGRRGDRDRERADERVALVERRLTYGHSTLQAATTEQHQLAERLEVLSRRSEPGDADAQRDAADLLARLDAHEDLVEGAQAALADGQSELD